MLYIPPKSNYIEHPSNFKYPKEDEQFLYFYFCKNETEEYIDLQQRVELFSEIIPVPNFFPYDSTINVQIKIKKELPAAEWIQWVLPYRMKAMVEIMGIPIQALMADLNNTPPSYYNRISNNCLRSAKDDSIIELSESMGQTKEQLYKSILEHYGSYLIWQPFYYTKEQHEKYKSVWNRPKHPAINPGLSYVLWHDVKWKSELRLYSLVKAYFPDAKMHYTSKWLEQQHLDIYSDVQKIAFEYQGKQHYRSIDYFDGDYGLRQRQWLDEKKRNLCKKNDVALIEWEYTTPIFPVYFLRKLRENGLNWKIKPSIYRRAIWEDMEMFDLNL